MTTVVEHLNSVLANVQNQKKTMDAAKKQAEIIGATLSPEVQSAIDVLLAAFPENPTQAIARIVGAQLQIKALNNTMGEVAALIAVLQTQLADENAPAKITQQMSANVIRSAAAANE